MFSKKSFLLVYILLIYMASALAPLAGWQISHAEDAALITPIGYQQWHKQRLGYRPDIVVVDMWAMWCSSCIEQFPDMVRLHNKYKDKNVTFISMNLDDRQDRLSLQAAEAFVGKINTDLAHFRMDENLLVAFKKNNLIGLPAVLIYDRQGEEAYRFTADNPNRQFTKNDIEQALNTLLDKP